MLGKIGGQFISRRAEPGMLAVVPVVELSIANDIVTDQTGGERLDDVRPVVVHPYLNIGGGGQLLRPVVFHYKGAVIAGVSGQGGDGNYYLSGRRAVTRPKPEYTGRDQGVVRVKIKVDRQGNVIYAKCSLQGTEVTDPALLRNAERAAMQTKWTANPTGETEQEGYIIYNFRIGG
jgi:TonB family protein